MKANENEKSQALARAEKMLSDLKRRRDKLIAKLHGQDDSDQLLLEIVAVARAVYALETELRDATGNGMKFHPNWDVHARLREFDSRRLTQLTAGGRLPKVETPWMELIEKIRSRGPEPEAA